jgi:hypothetical protein
MDPAPTLTDSPLRPVIRDLRAMKFLILCKLTGSIGALYHEGAWKRIYLWTDKDSTRPQNVSGPIVEPEDREFRIPRQDADPAAEGGGTSAFAGEIAENDQIAWVGNPGAIYIVGANGWDMTDYEAIYNINATKRTVRRAGP